MSMLDTEKKTADIRLLRQKYGLSQSKLSEITGISQCILSEYETEKKNIPINEYNKILECLSNKEIVKAIGERKKRYKDHTFELSKKKQVDRSKYCIKTNDNAFYINELSEIYNQHQKGKKNYSAISLFSGIGGFSLGFSAAGVRIKAFLELEDSLRNIYKDNIVGCFELGGDIRNVQNEKLEGLIEEISKIDFIIGGPPCQGFSLSGKRDVEDSRNTLFKEYIRFVDTVKPKIAVMENVRVLTSMKNEKGKYVIDDIYSSFQKINYTVKHFEINAKDYGVPQHRERVIFIAFDRSINAEPTIPAATYDGSGNSLFLPKQRTFADACCDLEYIESGEKSLTDEWHFSVAHPDHVINWLWNVKEGCSAHDNEFKELRPPSGYNTTYKRQLWNEPASTVQTTFGMISGCRNVHPIATRSLSIREAARIQSFPDQFKLKGSLGTVRTGIGNAVPPLLAYSIARHLIRILTKYGKNNQLPN